MAGMEGGMPYWIRRTGPPVSGRRRISGLWIVSIIVRNSPKPSGEELTKIYWPRRVPALDVLPLEQPSQELALSRHP